MRKFVFLVVCFFSSVIVVFSQANSGLWVSPEPGSEYINPEQTILVRTQMRFITAGVDPGCFQITGSKSGAVDFQIITKPTENSCILKPLYPFSLGEEVRVSIQKPLLFKDGSHSGTFDFTFRIKDREASIPVYEYDYPLSGESKEDPVNKASDPFWQSGSRNNNLPPDYPAPTVNIYSNNLDNDEIFINLSNRLNPFLGRYITIWDKYGTPVYYKKTPQSWMNFHRLPDGTLTYCPSHSSQPHLQKYYLMDSSFVLLDSLTMGNGYDVDVHDILLLPNGHYLMMSYDPQVVDMSQIVPGGNPDAIVTGLVIQEVDRNANVYFQWRSWDHFEITDATWDVNLLAATIDYCHGNSLELDYDNNLLLSSRNMDEITKISYPSGDIIWRFGVNAENNMFTITGDLMGFSHQHDFRRLENGNYTVYDNGNLHMPPVSRALEYNINEDNMIATLVWSYEHDPDIFAPATGSTRRLANGNTLIGWGTHYIEAVTEVTSENNLAMEIILPDNIGHYRAVKTPWKTNRFRTLEYFDFGNFGGMDDPKWYKIMITNTKTEPLSITSFYTMTDNFYVSDSLPLSIPGNGKAEMVICFMPQQEGEYNDILTLNSDNENNSQRIARQIELSGFLDFTFPYVLFDPERDEVNVDPSSEIKVIFSEPVRKEDGEEITDADIPDLIIFKENDDLGTAVGFTGIINTSKTIITLFPTEILKEEQLYFLELLPLTVQDYDGNVIETPEICYFTTGLHTAISNPANEGGTTVFPNPFKNNLLVSTGEDHLYIKAYDADGKLISEIEDASRELIINTSSWKPGIYYLTIFSGKSRYLSIHKIIKAGY